MKRQTLQLYSFPSTLTFLTSCQYFAIISSDGDWYFLIVQISKILICCRQLTQLPPRLGLELDIKMKMQWKTSWERKECSRIWILSIQLSRLYCNGSDWGLKIVKFRDKFHEDNLSYLYNEIIVEKGDGIFTLHWKQKQTIYQREGSFQVPDDNNGGWGAGDRPGCGSGEKYKCQSSPGRHTFIPLTSILHSIILFSGWSDYW